MYTYREDVTLEPVLLTGLPVDLPFVSGGDLHELVCLGMSSGEDSDDDDDIIAGLDDISVTEPDYPLYDQHLLARLLYDEEHIPNSDLESRSPLKPESPNNTDLSSPTEESQDAVDLPPPRTSPGLKPPSQELPGSKLTSKLTIKDPPSTGSNRTALSSYLGSGEKSLEGSIVRSLGLEKLTDLGRVSRARVAVESLSVEAGLVHRVLTQRGNKLTARENRSLFPLSCGSSSRYANTRQRCTCHVVLY